MNIAIRHPQNVRKVVSISAVFRHDGWVQEALAAYPKLTAPMINDFLDAKPTNQPR